ncbi:MAG: 5-methyltetrahydropteroyltriglutamate--homocysteine S-methyltransferase [Fibrobacterota bacterium]
MNKNTMITGFPRIGENRELKKALEAFWAGKISRTDLENTARTVRIKNWQEQHRRGIGYISSNDFSFYDSMLDTAIMLNAIPGRFRAITDPIDRYFAMARGTESATAMEMTKWFNTNYHYIVPELDESITFSLNAEKIVSEYEEALSLGISTKITLVGPITFVSLSKTVSGEDPFAFFDKILLVYIQLLQRLKQRNESIIVQFDEPAFVKNPSDEILSRIQYTYDRLSTVSSNIKIVPVTYFEHACEAVAELSHTNVWGIGLDFVHGEKNMDCLPLLGDKMLCAGVVDGRNIWITDLEKTQSLVHRIGKEIPCEQIIISTSCSLLHVPYSVKNEPESEVRPWLSFGIEKVEETALLARMFFYTELSETDRHVVDKNRELFLQQRRSAEESQDTEGGLPKKECSRTRRSSFARRAAVQQKKLNLPVLPVTTIGSFPQTRDIRTLRRDFKKGAVSFSEYEKQIRAHIDYCIDVQEEIGLDVLVHGEPERNDMVEYFGELLEGFHFTQNGWVQSYGSRCVKPPIIYGDVSRSKPMTVNWISYAQSRTDKPVKGMLTGPVTIINWSFVRTDISPAVTAHQVARALSEEIADLQRAGIGVIQVDEAAFKEGYPLRSENIPAYEKWAVESFQRTVSSAKEETQIHTHMCYSEFDDIIETIEAMDADVITLETARSGNRLLQVFARRGYANQIGPGVYDIHSPRIPSTQEFADQIRQRLEVLAPSKMWVNPDCGLKTRKWEEVRPALKNMVAAAQALRSEV